MADGENLTVSYATLGVYIVAVLAVGLWGAWLNFRNQKHHGTNSNQPGQHIGLVREHLMAGMGLGMISWFFSMAATLFSGYSVSGIVNEAFNNGWTVTRWIPGGIGVYLGFMVLAPRCHGLKSRGYMTMSELIFERYLPPSGPIWVAHALRIVSFLYLLVPCICYMITQFRSIGLEVSTFTGGGISDVTAVLVAAGVLLLCDILGGMRAVAYTDVLQGVVLLVGSIIFLVIQYTELGGLPEAFRFWSNPENIKTKGVPGMLLTPTKVQTVNYFDFVFKTTIAATMFPHLAQRMFCARSSKVMRTGLAAMNFSFFIVQLSSMLTGWVAIYALLKNPQPGRSAFAGTLKLVAESGGGQAFASAMLLASGICAMMSTADSVLLAFSTMWIRDFLKPYVKRDLPPAVQLGFGKLVGFGGLATALVLALKSLRTGTPDLTALFALQSVTPIHVAPAVWLGLHWRGLRGEAVLAGLVTGSAVTFGLFGSEKNIRRGLGDDMMENGLSTAWVGFCVNAFVTITVGLAMQFVPILMAKLKGVPPPPEISDMDDVDINKAHPRHLDIGPERDPLAAPWLLAVLTVLLLFTVPFCWQPYSAITSYVGNMASWAFTSLMLSGVITLVAAAAYILLWEDYFPISDKHLPGQEKDVVMFNTNTVAKIMANTLAEQNGQVQLAEK